ncbi:sensor histidine kinase [Methanolacinia paynteri]|uniref:sensor histidine kinase n=1 Tax=Methanolacinia paynteri TaxID=230356 RepID=UPI001B808990|nr:HAMP domain-containing sensor histidine kinase [Methanolacinia paynteri]
MSTIFNWDTDNKSTFNLYFSLIVVLVLFLIMEITYQMLFEETLMVVSHIFYFPIILCSFFLQKRGVIISTFIAMVYLIIINYLIPGMSEIVSSTMQFYVYISLSVTVSLISEKIRQDRRKFSSIFNYSESGIGLYNAKTGELVDRNKKFLKLMDNWTILDNLKKIEDACTTKHEDGFIEKIDEDSSVHDFEIAFNGDDGREYHAIVNASKIPGDFAVLTISEITEIRSYQKEIAALNRDLSDANEKANMYLDILIHDINNANAASLGYGELIKEGIPEDDEVYYDKMMTSIRHSSSIINNVARIRDIHSSSFKAVPTDLNKVIKSAVSEFTDLNVDSTVPELRIMGGPLLTDVFSIILENSSVYGGENVQISIRADEDKEFAYISVEDNGPGIPDLKKERLFKRFQPGGDGRRGRGLGLSVCWYIMNKYGGDIGVSDRIEGKPESGTVITIKLKKADQNEI